MDGREVDTVFFVIKEIAISMGPELPKDVRE